VPDNAITIDPPARILPQLNDVNRPFWTGGVDGTLLILRCTSCRTWVHPPTAGCPHCGGALLAEPVSGRGTIFTFTRNEQPFHPQVPPPYVIAIVELAEQSDLRIPTNIVQLEGHTLACGTPVSVLFEQQGEIYFPLFRPIG
jgi:uncharacterized OB-fold protein